MDSENIDQEITAKQQLLQKEIIEKNYDKGSFINFCLSKRENGDDLNNWTLSELETIVKEFVSSQNVPQSGEEPKAPGEEDINKENLEKMEKFNAEEPKTFNEKVMNTTGNIKGIYYPGKPNMREIIQEIGVKATISAALG